MEPHETPRLLRLLKAPIFALLLFLFFTTSFLVNLLQAINYLIFSTLFPDLRRWLNNYLQSIIQTSFIYVLEWQCPITFRVSYDSTETMTLFNRRENGLIIVNHSFDLDVFFYFIFAQMTNSLDSMKGFAKASLKRMPIIGWMFYFNDTIFLERNWAEDEGTISKSLGKIVNSKMPYKILIAPEGTRFSAEKYRISQEFIKKHDLSVTLKRHLLPRVKGFSATLRQILKKGDPHFALYNVEFHSIINDNYAEPTIGNYFLGKPFKLDVYVGKIPDAQVPTLADTDEAYADFLYSVFEQKDRLVEEHREYGRFPKCVIRMRQRSFGNFLKFALFNGALTGGLIGYAIYLAFLWNSLTLKLAIFGYIMGIFTLIVTTFQMAQVSNYGTAK